MSNRPSHIWMLAFLATLALGTSVSAQSDSFAIRAKKILPVSSDQPAEIIDGVIIVREGTIVAIGQNGKLPIPADLNVLEFADGIVTPGFIAASSSFGGQHRGDEAVAAGYHAVDNFDRFANYAEILSHGVTTIHVAPGLHRLLTGQGAVVKLGGSPENRILRPFADLTVNLAAAALNPPLDVTYSFPASSDVAIPPPRRQRPLSRMGQLLGLDESIRDALAGEFPDHYSVHIPALAKAWQDGIPMRIHANHSADIAAAVRFLTEKKRSGYVVGGAEADRVASALRTSKVPLVYQPRTETRSIGSNIGSVSNVLPTTSIDFKLMESVKLAIAPAEVSDLRLAASRAHGAGLSQDRALAAITRIPAEILGVSDRIGSLDVGKQADLVVLTGDPLAVTSHVQRVFIRGRAVFAPPERGPLVVKAAMVWAGPGKWISNGQVLAENGKIVAVGKRVPHPPFARVIDVRPDGFVTPGFIDAHSHLGLEGDRTAVASDLRLSKLVGAANRADSRVARAGITTVVAAPYAASGSRGAACAAIKTAGTKRDQRVIRDPAAVLFDLRSADPESIAGTLEKTLAAGQKYLDTWTKYEKELKEFLEKKAKGEQTTDKKEAETETAEQVGPDPVTGTWSATVTGAPTPDPVHLTIVIQLIDSSIEGRITSSSVGITGRITGHLDGKHLSAEIELDQDIIGLDPPLLLEADLVEEDHMKGSITAMGLTAAMDARRIDKSAVELKVVRQRRRGKDGRPIAPKVDESLEPLKSLLEKKIPAAVRVSTSAQIAEVVAAMSEKRELPLVLLGAEGAFAHSKKLADKKVPVVVPPRIISKRQYRDYHLSYDLSRDGVSIAFQSDAEDGARDLPGVVLYAVERGLSSETALEALTIGAARAYKIDDRVGTLEPGKDADLLIFNAHPFDEAGRLLRTVVNGKVVRP